MLGINGAKERRIALALGALLLVAVGAWLMYETRGTTLWFDEWIWALEYRDNSLGDLIRPHNGHPTLIPVLIYRLLFATVGIDGSAAYRAVGIAGHLLVVAVLFAYALRRAGAGVALVAAVLILLLGPGWQNIIWGLQIGWLVSIAGGLGALLALDRRDRAGDVAACGLIFVTIAASGPGIAIALGLIVEVVRERGLRRAWIVLAPLGVFAVWWLAYQDSGAVRRAVTLAPGFVADSAAATLSALAGLSGPLLGDESASLGWGRPLAVAAAAVVLWRLWRIERVPTRVLTLLAVLGAFWFLTAVQRAGIGPAESSRYVYVGAVFTVALAVELVRGVAIGRRAWLVIGGRGRGRLGGEHGRHAQWRRVPARAGAPRRARASRRWRSRSRWRRPTSRREGSPAIPTSSSPPAATSPWRATSARRRRPSTSSPARPENVRLRADEELAAIHGVTLQPSARGGSGTAPTVDAADRRGGHGARRLRRVRAGRRRARGARARARPDRPGRRARDHGRRHGGGPPLRRRLPAGPDRPRSRRAARACSPSAPTGPRSRGTRA